MASRSSKSSKSREWTATYLRLKKREQLLERGLVTSFARSSSVTSWIDELKAFVNTQKRSAIELDKKRCELLAPVTSCRELIGRLKAALSRDVNQADYVESIQRLVDSCEESLSDFKASARSEYCDMAKLSKLLEDTVNTASLQLNDAGNDLSASDGRTSTAPIKMKRATRELGKCFVKKPNGKTAIESRCSGRRSRGGDSSARDDRDLSKCTAMQMKSEIDRIQRLIDSDGGRHGFWDSRDHDHFLRLLPKIPDRTVLCERVSNEIPDTSPQQVAEHFEWYHRYCSYEKRKKEIVVQWKDAKKTEAQESIREHEERSEEKQRHMRQLAAERASERQNKATAVREWKQQREAFEREAAEREEAAALHEKNRHRAFLKRQARERAQRLARAKNQKDIERLELAKCEEAERRAKRPVITKAQRRKVQERAERMLESRKALIADKENRSREMEERVRNLAHRSRPTLDIKGGFSRLTGDTAAMKSRRERGSEENALHKKQTGRPEMPPAYYPGAGRRAQASWRRGVR